MRQRGDCLSARLETDYVSGDQLSDGGGVKIMLSHSAGRKTVVMSEGEEAKSEWEEIKGGVGPKLKRFIRERQTE